MLSLGKEILAAVAAGLSACPAELCPFPHHTPPCLSRATETHTAQSQQPRTSGGRIQSAALQNSPSKELSTGCQDWQRGFAHRAAAQDAMKMHGGKSPWHTPCKGSLGGHICSHCAFQLPLASCSSLSQRHCLSLEGCNVGCPVTCPDCLLPLPGCCSGLGWFRMDPTGRLYHMAFFTTHGCGRGSAPLKRSSPMIPAGHRDVS